MISEEILSPFREKLESALLDELAETARLISVEAGDTIMEPGQYIKTVPIVLKGHIRIMRRDDDGNEVLLYYIGSGDTCAMSLTCCVAHQKSNILAVADENSELLLIPAAKMEEWMMKYSSWNSFVMQTYNARFAEMLEAIDSIAFKRVDERLLQYLSNKSELNGTNVINVSHQQIADELNSSREVISRLLKTMENSGQIKLGRNRIELLD